MKVILNSCFLLLTIFFGSCKKYLDKAPDNLLAYPTTLNNLQAILDNSDIMNQGITASFAEVSANDFFLPDPIFNSINELDRQAYRWEVPNINTNNDWGKGYQPIFIANVCLESIESISRNNTNSLQWDNIKGAALFYRAYSFLHLAWTYAKAYDEATADNDLGIVIRKATDINEKSIRASVKATYAQVIEDAKLASGLLPDKVITPLRPSRAAAYALLARAYLSMRDYNNALTYANLCLAIKNHLIDYNNKNDEDLVNDINGQISPFRQFNKETIFYSETSTLFDACKDRNARIDSVLYASYSGNDLRKTAFFTSAGKYYQFKGSYSQNTFNLFSGITTSEMILIQSECEARKGNKATALKDLDMLLLKRWNTGTYTPLMANTAQEAINIILLERRKELVMRCLRWIDIKRLNKGGANIILKRYANGQEYNLPPNDNRYALPLPESIIEITGVPQNPR